jgi:hypothetical protein
MGKACVAHTEEMKNEYKVLVTKSEGKRSDGIPRCWWDSNIIMYFKEVRWEDVCGLDSVGSGPFDNIKGEDCLDN